MLTVDLVALLKRVDSFTNSLNVSTAALEIPNYCFSEGYWLTGLIICDKIELHSQKNYKGYLSSSKLKNSDGRGLMRCYGMERNKLG